VNLRRVKGKALAECTLCGSFAACRVYVRPDGVEVLVCGSDGCQRRLGRMNGTVHEEADRSLTEYRRAQGRDPRVSTEPDR